MRLTTSTWVAALLRTHSISGGFGTILRRGAGEAGAIFIVHRKPAGAMDLFGPAPQSEVAKDVSADRAFETVLTDATEPDVARYLERQVSFDTDCWIVEIEGGTLPEMLARIS